MKQNIKPARIRTRIDHELALTADLLDIAQRIALGHGWRVAVRACYYVIMRIANERGRRQLAEYLIDPLVGW